MSAPGMKMTVMLGPKLWRSVLESNADKLEVQKLEESGIKVKKPQQD